MPTFLHIGCGTRRKAETTPVFNTEAWSEIRLDVDPAVEPDLIGNPLDLGAAANGLADALYCRWDIGRLPPEAIPITVGEFRRVLKPVGIAVLACSDVLPPESRKTDARALKAHPLVKLFERAGFISIAVRATDPAGLQILASKGRRSDAAVKAMLTSHFPD